MSKEDKGSVTISLGTYHYFQEMERVAQDGGNWIRYIQGYGHDHEYAYARLTDGEIAENTKVIMERFDRLKDAWAQQQHEVATFNRLPWYKRWGRKAPVKSIFDTP